MVTPPEYCPRQLSLFLSLRLLVCDACLILVFALGCAPNPNPRMWPQASPTQTKSPLQVWRTLSSTPQDRVNAANTLISPGTKLEAVVELLGGDGVWCRYPGPTVDLNSPNGKTTKTIPDLWQLEYRIPGGE